MNQGCRLDLTAGKVGRNPNTFQDSVMASWRQLFTFNSTDHFVEKKVKKKITKHADTKARRQGGVLQTPSYFYPLPTFNIFTTTTASRKKGTPVERKER